MSKKIALVTGGTSGVGLSVARELVKRDFFVHVVGSNALKGASVEAELNAAGEVSRFVRLDLSDVAEVHAFALAFAEEHPVLDLLLNVAGVLLPRRHVTDHGFEKTFAVGYLAAFVLCTELAPALAKSQAPRILNVAGKPGLILKPDRLDFDDLGFERSYNGVRAAIDTIHAKTVLTAILAERLRGQGIDVNSFHPGAVKGDLGRSMPALLRPLFAVANLFMANTSENGVFLSTDADIQGTTGQFFVGRTPRPAAFEPAYKDALWARTEELLGPVLA
jgi:retinol dehydrogenase 12